MTKNNDELREFERWLKSECFQNPTPEAYDLAKSAWKEAVRAHDSGWMPIVERLSVLSLKHCPREHRDWDEICKLYDSIALSPESSLLTKEGKDAS